MLLAQGERASELRKPRIAELEGEPDHVPIERRRHIHIADERIT
jgi:hypothetical protein